MFKTIVVGVDGSDSSMRALVAACDLARTYKAELHLVHTPEMASVQMVFGLGPIAEMPSRDEISEAGAHMIKKAVDVAQAEGVTPASTTIGDGSVSQEILTIVELYDADMVVTGRRGLGSVSGLLVGSTSQKIAQSVSCACLTVK